MYAYTDPRAVRFTGHCTHCTHWAQVGGVLIMIVSCILLAFGESNLSPVQYYAAIFCMYASGYPIGHTAVLTWFSKLSKQAAEGFLLGWFGSAGSIGRIIFPALAGWISETWGNDKLFTCLGTMLLFTWGCIVIYFDTFTYLTLDWLDLAENGKIQDQSEAMLKAYLKHHNRPIDGSKEELADRVYDVVLAEATEGTDSPLSQSPGLSRSPGRSPARA